MEPNEQSSPPEDFYQQQLQFADRVFFGSSNSAGTVILNTVDNTTITIRPVNYTAIQRDTWGFVDMSQAVEPSITEDVIPPNSLFARIKIQKEKRKRKK